VSITRMLIALGLTVATVRADVIVIDPGGAPGAPLLIRALAAAAPGDVLLLQPGDYEQDFFYYVIDKGVTLLPASADARITLSPIHIQYLPAGQSVVLRGFDVHVHGIDFGQDAMFVSSTRGTVWVEDCHFTGSHGMPRSIPSPGGNAIDIVQAHAIFRHCSIAAGAGADAESGSLATPGGDALSLDSLCEVALYDCTLVGGDDGTGLSVPLFPIHIAGRALYVSSSDVTISGCTLTGGKEGADNDLEPGTSGSALVVKGEGLAAVRVLQSVLLPGAVQGLGTQAPAVDAEPSTVEMLSEPARSLVLPALAQVGQVVTLLLDGERGDLALIMMSPVAAAIPVESLEGTLAVQPGSFGSPIFVGVLPGPDGKLSLPVSSAGLPPGVEGQTIFAQGVFVDADGRSLGGASAITWVAAGP
jgi:hypothetical protein